MPETLSLRSTIFYFYLLVYFVIILFLYCFIFQVAWFYNGNKLEESDRVKITTNTTTSTLHMDDCTMEMDGVYECRIDNKLGSDKTKASLIISPQSD